VITRNNANGKTNLRESGGYDSKILYADLSYVIQGCIFEIRKQYGPGQKEVIYQRLLIEKLELKGLSVIREQKINIYSQDSGKVVGTYQPDLIVNDCIVIELKSTNFTTQTDEKQLYFYLRNSKYELGYLINFSTPELFMKRMVYSNDRKPYIR
jgi:GxxExxY protein